MVRYLLGSCQLGSISLQHRKANSFISILENQHHRHFFFLECRPFPFPFLGLPSLESPSAIAHPRPCPFPPDFLFFSSFPSFLFPFFSFFIFSFPSPNLYSQEWFSRPSYTCSAILARRPSQ